MYLRHLSFVVMQTKSLAVFVARSPEKSGI
jgi:hypothetical protein